MFWTNLRARYGCAIFLLLAGGMAATAQSVPSETPSGKSSGGPALTAALVKTGLFTISGGGCNSLLRLSGNGFILVDGKLPGSYPAILSLTRKLSFSEQPIRILIDTDYRENHTGNNAKFLESGTQILAQENVKRILSAAGNNALPTRTYDREFTIRIGGIEAQLLHFGNAHTNGDTVVYFPNLKVVAVGDLFTPDTPDPDFAAGGSLVGWGPVLAEILKLDFDVAVPGAGPPVTRAALEAFKSKIDTLVSRAAGLVKQGVPKNLLMARLETGDLGWRFHFTGEALDAFYAELTRHN